MAKFERFPCVPRDAQGAMIFREAWRAEAVALTERMIDRKVFSYDAYAAAMKVENPGGPPSFAVWARVIERLLRARVQEGVADATV